MSDTVIEMISATDVIVPAKPGSLNSDTDIYGELVRQDDLIRDPIRFENGSACVPQGAGPGIELDEPALEKYGTRQCVTESL